MLNRRMVAALLGGGAGLVCNAGRAVGQTPVPHGGTPIGIVGDPTPITPAYCALHLLPNNSIAPGSGAEPNPMGWLLDPATGSLSTWIESNAGWTRDRRPMLCVQMGSNGYEANPFANPNWWYIPHYGNAGVNGAISIDPDQLEDNWTANLPENGGELDTKYNWLHVGDVNLQQPNGIPDQFDALVRILRKSHNFGVRRVMMHLPAGVIAGKLVGYDYNAQGVPIFNGPHHGNPNFTIYSSTNQSMNQFVALPLWKQSYFNGELFALNGFPAQNAWTTFKETYCNASSCNPSDPDRMDIEVYIGGGIGLNGSNLGTEPNDNGETFARDADRLRSFTGFGTSGDPEYKFMWRKWYDGNTPPYPIDPRFGPGDINNNMRRVWPHIKPWIETVGVKRLWLDAASENIPSSARRWGALELAHNPYLTSNCVRIGGETIPTIDLAGGGEILDDCAIINMPWLANFSVMSYEDNAITHHRSWKSYAQTPLSRANTEVHILDNTDTMTWTQWKEARERGYVVGYWNVASLFNPQPELMKRWYNMGWIQVADFNGNNSVTPQDAIDAHAIIELNKNNPAVWPRVFGNGDINDDGFITDTDHDEFDLYYNNGNSNLKRDYGTPRASDL